MKSRKYILIVSLLCLLFISSVATILFLKSETAGRYIVNRLSTLTDKTLTIKRVQGNLLTGLKLEAIDYHMDQQHVLVEQAQLVLNPFELLGGTLHLSRVEMTGITCTLSENAELFSETMLDLLPNDSLPFKVLADDVRLNGVVLHHGDRQYNLGQIVITAVIDEQILSLKRFEVKEKEIHFKLTGDTKLISPYPFQAALRWVGQYKSNRFRGNTDIQGDINAVQFNHHLYEPRRIGIGGEIHVSRLSPNTFQLEFAGDLNGQDIPSTTVHMSGRFDPQHFKLEKLTANSLGGKINATGDMHWQSSLQWDLNLNGAAIDPGEQWALWKGKLDFGAKVSGQINAGVPIQQINDIRVVGNLLNQPFQTSGGVQLNDREMTIESLNIRSGRNQLALNGTASRDSNLRFEFDVPEPAHLWTGIYGHFRGNGIVTGDFSTPAGMITLDGSNMRYGDYQLKKAAATIEIDLNNPSASNGRARLHDFRVSDQYFSDISVDWTGDFRKHRVLSNIVSPSTTMALVFSGSCLKDDCQLSIDIASFDLQQHGPWQLNNPVGLSISPDEIKPFSSCWVQEGSDICLNSSWSDADGWKTNGDVDAPAVASILVVLKEVLNKEHLGWDTHNNQ